ncbi:hypothetical protein EG329_012689 [Mollisiaceae sp. DMI_Dod_QoI]|nr:hypothetical protein EG329_012689 [Helotiales sp. DMI_Dod_QoI]
MKLAFKTFSPPGGGAISLYLLGLLSILPRISAAKFDADTFFTYIDKSCKDSPQSTVKAAINTAGEEMNFLVRSTLSEGFNFDSNDLAGGRAGRAFKAFWGQLDGTPSITDPANTEDIKDNFEKLGDNMPAKHYGIYCDGSAFEFITSWPADTPTGDGWGTPGEPIDGGAWYIKDPMRRVPDGDYLGSPAPNPRPVQPGDDICTPNDDNGIPKGIAGASLPDANYIVMCPTAFSVAIGEQLATFGKTPLPDGEDLDWFASPGASMLHEFTHAVLSTEDKAYSSEGCIDLVTEKGPEDARINADSYMFFALASYLNQNEWINDGAASPLQAAVKPAGVSRRITRNKGRKIKRQNFWTNGTVTSSVMFPSPTISSGTTSISSIFPSSTSSVVSISSQSKISSITASFSLNSTTSASETSITISQSKSSLSITKINPSFSSTSSPTLSPSLSSSSVAQTSTTKTRSASSILPSGITTSILTSSSGAPLIWSGSWSDTTIPTLVSLSFIDLPTGTVAPSEQTSDAVLLQGLFSALKNSREWLTDPKLRSQYIENVKEVKDQTLALFNKMDVNIPEPDCSSTSRKRGENTISERQLKDVLRERSSLQDRSVLSGVANVIEGAIHDVAKLLSCAVYVMDNLVDSVNKDTPNVDLIQDLTDSLAAVGDALDKPGDEPTKTNPTSTSAEASKTTSTESTSSLSSSSRSSSCSMSTAIPICTQTVILSTSYLSERSTFTVDSTTTHTCSTITIKRCTASGSTSSTATTASGSEITGYTFKTFIMDPANTASQFVDTSQIMRLSSILATETLASRTNSVTRSSPPTSSILNTTASLSSSSNSPTSSSSPTLSSIGVPSSTQPTSTLPSSSPPASSIPSSSLLSSSIPSSSPPSSTSSISSAIVSGTNTMAPSPTSTSFWELTLYNTTCEDHASADLSYSYYTLTGSGPVGSNSCTPLQNPPQDSLDSCVWFTDAGVNPGQPCSAGTFQYPTSYVIRNGFCVVYSDDDCSSGETVAIDAANPLTCSDTSSDDGLPTTWLSFRCGVSD